MGLFGNKDKIIEDIMMEDPTAWMVDSSISDFFLFKTKAIKYLCMFGYAYMAGKCSVF
jgi:hypothetical protein